MKKTKILDNLKRSVGKRKPVVTARRRLSYRYLNDSEIETLKESVQYSSAVLSSSVFGRCVREFRQLKHPDRKTLATIIFTAAKPLVSDEDVVLIDKDYDYETMRSICSYASTLFRKAGKKVSVEIGTSYNEAVALADMVAGLARMGKMTPTKIGFGDIDGSIQKL